MHEFTFTDVDRLHAGEADEAFAMDEDAFRAFYDRTARPVWAYLSRLTGDVHLADDLLQETYYRFLRTSRTFDSEAHRRNYLFRIATNLVRDGQRRHRVELVPLPEDHLDAAPRTADDPAAGAARRADLTRAMARLTARERELLWLAYAQGSSHEEIAESLGLKTASIKMLLFRARRRMAELLGGGSRRAAAPGAPR
jgi:RNA polymerase sigma-70 factor, ECF subfamily